MLLNFCVEQMSSVSLFYNLAIWTVYWCGSYFSSLLIQLMEWVRIRVEPYDHSKLWGLSATRNSSLILPIQYVQKGIVSKSLQISQVFYSWVLWMITIIIIITKYNDPRTEELDSRSSDSKTSTFAGFFVFCNLISS